MEDLLLNLLLFQDSGDIIVKVGNVCNLTFPLENEVIEEKSIICRNENYHEVTIPRYSDLQFKEHFRMSRQTFQMSETVKRKSNGVEEVEAKLNKTDAVLRLSKTFYNVPCAQLANSLLGKLLVRKLSNGEILKGRIVETEMYPGGEDKASYSYNGRRTAANEPMYMDPGTTFVYMTYGMYYCLNISSLEPGGAVLIRALQPEQGVDCMMELRKKILKKSKKPIKQHELCNGPSKLCSALSIDKVTCNALDLVTSDCFWVEDDGYSMDGERVISAKRIGIDKVGGEWVDKPFRYYIYGNVNVSKKDAGREREIIGDGGNKAEDEN